MFWVVTALLHYCIVTALVVSSFDVDDIDGIDDDKMSFSITFLPNLAVQDKHETQLWTTYVEE